MSSVATISTRAARAVPPRVARAAATSSVRGGNAAAPAIIVGPTDAMSSAPPAARHGRRTVRASDGDRRIHCRARPPAPPHAAGRGAVARGLGHAELSPQPANAFGNSGDPCAAKRSVSRSRWSRASRRPWCPRRCRVWRTTRRLLVRRASSRPPAAACLGPAPPGFRRFALVTEARDEVVVHQRRSSALPR